ncbi:hypothetical protein EAE96_007733 [Botrytis aclada]|nr:hypothetical protein EAE96_007733 [Botrytis aclada]
METKSPINTNTNTNMHENLPSTQIAHSEIPTVVENHNLDPHTGTGTGTGNGIGMETRSEFNTSHSDLDIHTQPPPPSYNAHSDAHSSEKRTMVENHLDHARNETPPQFQIQPELSRNANDMGGNAGRYEGHHPAPLSSLQKESRLVRCPRCGVCEYTGVEWVSGGTADVSALLCCLCFCLPCVPYLMTSFKDVHHKCANCGFLVAVWKRSGKTEVSVAASAAAASGGATGAGGK